MHNKVVHGTNYIPLTCGLLHKLYHMLATLRWSRDHGVNHYNDF
jgi:hypothetical protein